MDGIITSVVSIVQIPAKDTLKHIQRIQTITIVWMSVEAALSLWAAWTARSPALAAFSGDSTVELLSAVVVLWRFRTHSSEHAEQLAARIAGGLLFALAAYVVLASIGPDRKCCSEGRCCRICLVRLPLNHRAHGSCGSRNLARCMGRPGCSIGNRAAHRVRGSGGHARRGLWLLLTKRITTC